MGIDLETVKAACARVLAPQKRKRLLGSAYLIYPHLAATAAHVVKLTHGYRENVVLMFGDGVLHSARVTNLNKETDCALLELDQRVEGIVPLPLSNDLCPPEMTWKSYGFPGMLRGAMMQVDGVVKDPNLPDDQQRPGILISVAGERVTNENMRGFSGSPVVIEGTKVVGHLRRLVANVKGVAQLNKLYAAHARDISALLPEELGARKSSPALPPPGASYRRTWYVNLPQQEQAALNNLAAQGAPVLLSGPEWLGKTWLLDYLLEQLRETAEPSDRFVEVDVTELDLQSMDHLARDFAARINEQLEPSPGGVDATWQGAGSRGGKLSRWLESKALTTEASPGRLFLAVEQADLIWKAGLGDQFFPLLKVWSQVGRNANSPLARLRIILSVSTAPALWRRDLAPLNVVDPIFVDGLDDQQVAQLASKYGLQLSADDLKKIMEVVGGHPYVLSVVFFKVALHRLPLGRVVQETLQDCVRYCRSLGKVNEDPELRDAVCQLLKDPRAVIDVGLSQRLKDGGLMVQAGTDTVPRFGLYRAYLRKICGL
jgi:hypothetical protein